MHFQIVAFFSSNDFVASSQAIFWSAADTKINSSLSRILSTLSGQLILTVKGWCDLQRLGWRKGQEFWEASQAEKSLTGGEKPCRRKALQEKSLAGGPAHFSQASLSWKALLSLTWCCSISQRWSACRRTFFHINANSGLPFSTSGYFWRDQTERSFKQLLLVQ